MAAKVCSRRSGEGTQPKPSSSSLSGLRGPSSARNADATTTVGSTNGTITRAFSSRFPGKSKRAKRYAAGIARTTVRIVDRTACQSVNQATSRTNGRPRTASASAAANRPPGASPSTRIAPTGRQKKTSRKSSGPAASASVAARRLAEDDVGPLLDPAFTLRAELERIHPRRLGDPGRVLGEGRRQLGRAVGREDEHVQRHVLLEARREHEVDEYLCFRLGA